MTGWEKFCETFNLTFKTNFLCVFPRSGSHPSASSSSDPDIKIVGESHPRQPPHSLVLDKRDQVKVWRDPGLLQRDQQRQQAPSGRPQDLREPGMADPRHPLGLPPTSHPSLTVGQAANLHALAAHYPPGLLAAAGAAGLGSSLPPHHLPSLPPAITPQTLLQYQQLAAASGKSTD